MKSRLQVSLRELFLLVLFAALGLASLRGGEILGSIVVMLAILAATGFAIVAFVGRNSIQARETAFPPELIARFLASRQSSDLSPPSSILDLSRMASN